jgi:hypothetical protein
MRFTDPSLDKFWISGIGEYPAIHRKAVNILLQFSTLYACEKVSSCLTSIRSKAEIISFQLKMNSACAYLKVDPEISTSAVKNKQRFYIKEANFILILA